MNGLEKFKHVFWRFYWGPPNACGTTESRSKCEYVNLKTDLFIEMGTNDPNVIKKYPVMRRHENVYPEWQMNGICHRLWWREL